jgi:hypothetical protein
VIGRIIPKGGDSSCLFESGSDGLVKHNIQFHP